MEEVTVKYEPIVATPLNNGELATVLDEEKYTTLSGMLKSKDEGNHKIAQLILNTCDIEKSIYWIWQLTKTGGVANMVNLRTKASRAFRDKSHLFTIWGMSPLAFAEFCNKEGWLTPEIYKKAEDDIVAKMVSQFKNTFYDVQFVIKEKYQHLPLTKTVIPIKHE